MTDEAKQAFQKAVAGDPHDPKAGYFLGLADEQDGNARCRRRQMARAPEGAPADAPWADFVREALARVTGEPVAANGPDSGRRRGRGYDE